MFKLCIIGAGFGYSVHVPAVLKTRKFSIVGIISQKQIKGFKTFNSIDLFLESQSVDIFLIATPPHTHLNIAKKIIPLKKPIYFEKPFCKNYAEANELNSLLKLNKVKHCIGYQFRYEIAFMKLKELILKCRIGEIKRINVDWLVAKEKRKDFSWKNHSKYGAGIELNYLTHCIDYLKCLTNFKKLEIYSNLNSNNLTQHKVTDSIDLILILDKNIIVNIRICNNLNFSIGHKIQVLGENSNAELFWEYPFDESSTYLKVYNNRKIHYKLKRDDSLNVSDTRIKAIQFLWEDFYNVLKNKKNTNVPNAEQALEIHKHIKEIVPL